MTDQQSGWRAPEIEPGPAPGVEFAGYGARIVGYIIDGIILTILVAIIWIVASAFFVGGSSFTVDANGEVTSGSVSGAAVSAVLVAFVATVVISILYFPWFWARGGQTPGQKVTGIKVVRDTDGGPISWGSAFLRLIGYWISGLVLYLGYIWVFIDKRRRGWFDLIGGTVVIKAP
jgi:uncharacterized RDD family membrane protein YckC